MENKKVSVVIPCYNLEKVIGRCLDSLLSQTYENLEILVVDDGSKDDSTVVVGAYAQRDSRVQLICQPNGGPSAARNHGIDLATGEYLMFIDGDDYVADTYVQRFAEAAEDCDVVIGGFCGVEPDGTLGVVEQETFCCNRETYLREYYSQTVAKRTIFGPYNKLFRRATVGDVRFDRSIAIREDGIFVLEVLARCQWFRGIDYSGYYYVQNDTGSSLVSKFHPGEPAINQRLFRMLVDFPRRENLTDIDIARIYPMYLNMELSSIRKLYLSPSYSLKAGLSHIRDILRSQVYREARREYLRVAGKRALKYYRPLWMMHAINHLAAKKRKR